MQLQNLIISFSPNNCKLLQQSQKLYFEPLNIRYCVTKNLLKTCTVTRKKNHSTRLLYLQLPDVIAWYFRCQKCYKMLFQPIFSIKKYIFRLCYDRFLQFVSKIYTFLLKNLSQHHQKLQLQKKKFHKKSIIHIFSHVNYGYTQHWFFLLQTAFIELIRDKTILIDFNRNLPSHCIELIGDKTNLLADKKPPISLKIIMSKQPNDCMQYQHQTIV
eukprot:TRINITY_DN6404_c0_g1_i2.p2 TRINITY_DN6404_c0_g1~~TRINITY_DN6404_c0_g1_i2.p2  ORF type:complete len:215 (-),score=-25.84 TRINITY_DN6404_c0_g1_i2:178-822(-)